MRAGGARRDRGGSALDTDHFGKPPRHCEARRVEDPSRDAFVAAAIFMILARFKSAFWKEGLLVGGKQRVRGLNPMGKEPGENAIRERAYEI
jgi:hypothetical protein